MDTSLWLTNGKQTRSGLIVAPEDYVLECEATLTGVVKAKPSAETAAHIGKAFFTYAEALALYEQGFFPEGWRLPTYEEAVALIEEFVGDDDFTSHGFMQKLRCNFNGYVYPKMEKYNEDPTPVSEFIERKYMESRFWLYNPDQESLYALHVKRHGRPTLQTFGPSCGNSVRLVHDP